MDTTNKGGIRQPRVGRGKPGSSAAKKKRACMEAARQTRGAKNVLPGQTVAIGFSIRQLRNRSTRGEKTWVCFSEPLRKTCWSKQHYAHTPHTKLQQPQNHAAKIFIKTPTGRRKPARSDLS